MMMMMATGWIPVRQAGEVAIVAMAMLMTTVRVRRICRAGGQGLEKGTGQRMGTGKGWQLKTGCGKGRGMGRETDDGKVLLKTPLGDMISHMPLL
jgi:hypothetical protein